MMRNINNSHRNNHNDNYKQIHYIHSGKTVSLPLMRLGW